jgi:hypothetical protein
MNPVFDNQAPHAALDVNPAQMVDVQLTEPTHGPMARDPLGDNTAAMAASDTLRHSSLYGYNLETGLLEQAHSAGGQGGKASKMYVEDCGTGGPACWAMGRAQASRHDAPPLGPEVALPSSSLWRLGIKLVVIKREWHGVPAGDFRRVQSEPAGCCCCPGSYGALPPPQQQQQAWQQGGQHGSSFAAVVEAASSCLSAFGLCAQGLLGGLALLLLFMTYIAFADAPMAAFLQYYAPLALVINR